MSSKFGKTLQVSIFGQSHGEGIGVLIDGLPPGEKLDMAAIDLFMRRRAPGRSRLATARQEGDKAEFIAGLVDSVTCGAPVCAIIRNQDTRSQDYQQMADIPRPGHADYPAAIRYKGAQDVRGGGHFSGRLTAPLCIAGAICLQLLAKRGISVGAHIASIADIDDDPLPTRGLSKEFLGQIADKPFAVINDLCGEKMQQAILSAAAEHDSLGGIIECCAINFPAGVGNPLYDGLDNRLAQAIFGIPAIKGLEFGSGFAAARSRGSVNNDPWRIENGKVITSSNHHGGILGGLSSGMPIVFRVAIKPTPSIAKTQSSISLSRQENTSLNITGRHDPCIVPRAVPCLEAVTAIVLLDFLLEINK
ncbi:MAG: chorismate synthase [Porticoccaceae bacterium]|nr:chorismate synthase [Porticoccaceae bacterium]